MADVMDDIGAGVRLSRLDVYQLARAGKDCAGIAVECAVMGPHCDLDRAERKLLEAKALLEGKSATAERLIIQVGAFSDAAKLREVRQKLEKGGFKTYTQVVDGKDGKTTTRVRVGPYDSRDEADKAAVRIRKLDLSAAILKL